MNDSEATGTGLPPRNQNVAPDFRQQQDAGNVDRRWWETGQATRSSARAPSSPQVGSAPRVDGSFTPPPPPPPLNPEWMRAAAQPTQPTVAPQPAHTTEAPGRFDGAGAPAHWGFSTGAPQPAPAPDPMVQGGAPGASTDPTTSAQAAAAQASLEALTVQRLELELAAARDEATALHEMLEDLPEIFERKFRQRLQSILEQQQRLLADNQTLREQLYTLAPGAPGVETRPSRLLLPSSQPSMPPLAKRSPLGETLRKVLRLGRPTTPDSNDPDRFA